MEVVMREITKMAETPTLNVQRRTLNPLNWTLGVESWALDVESHYDYFALGTSTTGRVACLSTPLVALPTSK